MGFSSDLHHCHRVGISAAYVRVAGEEPISCSEKWVCEVFRAEVKRIGCVLKPLSASVMGINVHGQRHGWSRFGT